MDANWIDPTRLSRLVGQQRRTLIAYLLVTGTLYMLGVALAVARDHGYSLYEVPPDFQGGDTTGGIVGILLTLAALGWLLADRSDERGLLGPLTLASLATPVVMAYHVMPSAQMMCLTACMFLAMISTSLLPAAWGRPWVIGLSVLAGGAMVISPMPFAPFLGLVGLLGIICAGEYFGSFNRSLVLAACRDGLTGLRNRVGFDLVATAQLRKLSLDEPVSLVVIDLDDFKAVNDTHGHLAGDRLLQTAARAWSSVLRPREVLARFGGDEFVILLPGCDAEEAARRVGELKAADTEVGWSHGSATCYGAEDHVQLYREADDRLYRDRARAAGSEPTGHG